MKIKDTFFKPEIWFRKANSFYKWKSRIFLILKVNTIRPTQNYMSIKIEKKFKYINLEI